MPLLSMLMDGMPHGYCLLWNPSLLWLHAGSDAAIAAAYFMIPLSLLRYSRARPDVSINNVYFSFAAFILLCGTTHLLSIYNIWVPNWWLSGSVKAATGVASIGTAVLLTRLVPQVIALPSPAQLRDANDQLAASNVLLSAQVAEREGAQLELSRAHDDAEELVRVRTAELAESNRKLESSEDRYRALVQASSDAVWTVNADGSALDLRQWSEFTGMAPDTPGFGVHPDDAEHVMSMWAQALRTEEPYASQHRLARSDGTWRYVRVQAVPVFEPNGRVREWVGSHLDVTEQVESLHQLSLLQEQLQQSQRLEAVGRLAGGIAHDFNNLLTVIVGAGSLVLEDLPRDHQARQDVEDVVAAGTRAAALTAQLLAYSRKQVLQPRILSINAVLTDVQAMLCRLIGEQVRINLTTRADDWTVRADPNQLEQVILNLALNARDAMPDGGSLTFETEHVVIEGDGSASHVGVTAGEYVMLSVSDTGTGMDELTRSQIFEPFFTTKSVGAGTGLGLATVYGIVRQSGGHIYVYSELGLGTTFKIYLPRQGGDTTPSTLIASGESLASGAGQTILLVEDAVDVREFVTRVLTRSGYIVRAADGPESAIALLKADSSHIDLLLSDVIMPGMSGRALADIVVQQRPEIAVLFMSGYTDNAIVHHGVLDPRTNFLHKPFSPDQLLRLIRRILARRGVPHRE